jgi:hypothetical protein
MRKKAKFDLSFMDSPKFKAIGKMAASRAKPRYGRRETALARAAVAAFNARIEPKQVLGRRANTQARLLRRERIVQRRQNPKPVFE